MVGRLIEDEEVGAAERELRQRHAPAFTAGERADGAEDIIALEQEQAEVAARLADGHGARIEDLVEDRAIGIERFVCLCEVGGLHRRAQPYFAGQRRQFADDRADECALARAIRADQRGGLATAQHDIGRVEQRALRIAYARAKRAQHQIAAADGLAEAQFHAAVDLGAQDEIVALQPFQSLEPPFGLRGVLRAHVPTDVFLLPTDVFLLRFVLPQQALVALCPLLGIGAVVATIALQRAEVEFPHRAGDRIEEVAIVADDDHRAGEIAQVALQPLHSSDIEMIGGLVQRQHVRCLQQQPTEQRARLLPAGQSAEGRVEVLRAETHALHHRADALFVRVAARRLEAFLQFTIFGQRGIVLRRVGQALRQHSQTGFEGAHLGEGAQRFLAHSVTAVKLGTLGQIADAHAFRPRDFAL